MRPTSGLRCSTGPRPGNRVPHFIESGGQVFTAGGDREGRGRRSTPRAAGVDRRGGERVVAALPFDLGNPSQQENQQR